jgi:hypothetical protein
MSIKGQDSMVKKITIYIFFINIEFFTDFSVLKKGRVGDFVIFGDFFIYFF